MKHYYFKILIFTMTFSFISSCSIFDNYLTNNKFYFKSGYQNVKINSERDDLNNIHPIDIHPTKIEGALKLVLIKYGYKPEPLFQENKIYSYSVAISEALKDAKKNQDVIFTVEGWYKEKRLSQNRVTSGRIFYNKDGLNIIFGSILRKGVMSETDSMLSYGLSEDLRKNPYAPGSRFQTIKNQFGLTALPNSGVFRPRQAKKRNDWLVFTKRALQPRGFLSQKEKRTALGSNIEVKDLRRELQNLKQELRSMRGNQEQIFNRGEYQYQTYQNNYPRYRPPNSRQNYYGYYPNQNAYNNGYRPETRNSTPRTKTNGSISLKSLESLRERGLISEESYLKKLKELGY